MGSSPSYETSEPEGEWGVIARTEEISILEARQRLEALAAKYGGEYDGWEAQPDIQASFGGWGRRTN